MAKIKVVGHTRNINGRNVSVDGHDRQIKTPKEKSFFGMTPAKQKEYQAAFDKEIRNPSPYEGEFDFLSKYDRC